MLAAAHAAAERQVFVAMPRALPVGFSLPAARELGDIKVRMAAVQLRLSVLQAKVREASADCGPSYPLMEGREDPGIAEFVKPE